MKFGVSDGQIGTVRQQKSDGIFVTIDCSPVQPRPAQNPFCINVSSMFKQ